jgi:hypothetical protein
MEVTPRRRGMPRPAFGRAFPVRAMPLSLTRCAERKRSVSDPDNHAATRHAIQARPVGQPCGQTEGLGQPDFREVYGRPVQPLRNPGSNQSPPKPAPRRPPRNGDSTMFHKTKAPPDVRAALTAEIDRAVTGGPRAQPPVDKRVLAEILESAAQNLRAAWACTAPGVKLPAICGNCPLVDPSARTSPLLL